MAQDSAKVKELWGTRFDIVSKGLSEEQVVSFVTDVMAEAQKAREEQERQSSLVKLAEQTVLEAERLAQEIKDRATKAAADEGARMREELQAGAAEAAEQLRQSAQSDIDASTKVAIAKSRSDAQKLLTKAKTEAESLLKEARARIASMESEAKLEAEFEVRRITQSLVEGIRRSVTETCNDILPSIEDMSIEREADSGDRATARTGRRS